MAYFFSKTTRGWYHSDIHSEMPEDAIEVSDEVHRAIMAEHDKGMRIVGDENGNPMAVPHVDALEFEEAKKHVLKVLQSNYHQALAEDFHCDALGAPHYYSSAITEQLKMAIGLALATSGGPPPNVCLLCEDELGDRRLREHDNKQLGQVALCFQLTQNAFVGKHSDLVKAVKDAKDHNDLRQIAW